MKHWNLKHWNLEQWKLKQLKPVYTVTLGALTLAAASLATPVVSLHQGPPRQFAAVEAPNGHGIARTITTAATFDTENPFFKPLGINGRTCATCHPADQGMTITPDYAAAVFEATQGLDPLFATVDGTNSPDADMSTVEARRNSCSMLLNRGVIRIGLAIPANAEFTLVKADDPYRYASARELSCFRRPLPATNLRFLSTVMWDGRERTGAKSVLEALNSQVISAVLGHMQGATPPSAATIASIVDFETRLYTTQVYDDSVGDLDTPQIDAGPEALVGLPFFLGINNAFVPNGGGQAGGAGNRGLGRGFDPDTFTFYRRWLMPRPPQNATAESQAQLSVARGEQLFNTRQFTIKGVAGLNDVVGKSSITGTCSSCHSTHDVGSNSLPFLLNTGIADGKLRTADMPLYTLRNRKTGAIVQTTDPGAALTSGKWADIGKFKVPSLRALETQSPYMHNGFSGDLLDVVNFYNSRFQIGLSEQEKADLKAFLTTL